MRSKFSKRGITPGPGGNIKLLTRKVSPFEKDYNIITNRGLKDHSPSSKIYGNGVLKTQNDRDYVDYANSEFSYDYSKISKVK